MLLNTVAREHLIRELDVELALESKRMTFTLAWRSGPPGTGLLSRQQLRGLRKAPVIVQDPADPSGDIATIHTNIALTSRKALCGSRRTAATGGTPPVRTVIRKPPDLRAVGPKSNQEASAFLQYPCSNR